MWEDKSADLLLLDELTPVYIVLHNNGAIANNEPIPKHAYRSKVNG